jgi:hypothetical protein
MMSEWWIGKNVEKSGHGLILRYYTSICLEGLGKTLKTLSQDSLSLGQDLNPGPPDYKEGQPLYDDIQCLWKKEP